MWSAAKRRASRNRIRACTRGPAGSRLVGMPNRRVAADRSPGLTDDGRVVRDFKLEPTAREV